MTSFLVKAKTWCSSSQTFEQELTGTDGCPILTFNNGRTLIANHGEISEQEVVHARNQREAVLVTSVQEAQPKIKAQMLFPPSCTTVWGRYQRRT